MKLNIGWLKRVLVHLSLVIGVSAILVEQDQFVTDWFPQHSDISDSVSSGDLLTQAIQEKIKEKSEERNQVATHVPVPSTQTVIPEDFLNLNELRSIKWQGFRLQLVNSLSEDQFKGHSIFEQLSTYSSIASILKQDIVGFERGTLRSGQYKDASGFDQIYYKIFHNSGKISHILIRDAAQVEISVFTSFGSSYQGQTFANGVWVKDLTLTESETQAQVTDILNGSSSILSASVGSI